MNLAILQSVQVQILQVPCYKCEENMFKNCDFFSL